jgi:hypothetical protein
VETAVARAAAAARTKRRAPPISPASMGDGRGMRPMWEERQSTGQWVLDFPKSAPIFVVLFSFLFCYVPPLYLLYIRASGHTLLSTPNY